ncbi:Flp family type IVb pilin [Thermoflexibacter ruber]|uniref:Flp/Fap pilin component n=1 Tax=Thermoflexibacter ruber TaxID=1003 RepID=A0A1I2IQG8_9BACT|nr:Flp/Fap pilin component [Thermoflexibacter ruber]
MLLNLSAILCSVEATAIEYALIAALISVAVILAFRLLGQQIRIN